MKKDDLAPDFEAINQEGALVSLSAFLETGPVVLFFYPKAMTPGCTVESCHFRDLESEFAELGAQPIGIAPIKSKSRKNSIVKTNLDSRCFQTLTKKLPQYLERNVWVRLEIKE